MVCTRSTEHVQNEMSQMARGVITHDLLLGSQHQITHATDSDYSVQVAKL